jgi:sugar/nucleoside kinase (ribokinase family)
MDKKGIVVAGSVLVDKINEISAFPECGELTQITSIQNAVGGCVPNVALDLKKISPETPIFAVGKIGVDEEGEFVKKVLADGGVDVNGLVTTDKDRTSFTDVMSVKGGQRTFFTYAGASADFGTCDVDFENMNAEKIKITLSGRAVFADYRRIEEYIEKNGLGECEVNVSFGK